MKTYEVEVTRDPGWGLWHLDGDEGIERVAREIIALWEDVPPDSFDVSIKGGPTNE